MLNYQRVISHPGVNTTFQSISVLRRGRTARILASRSPGDLGGQLLLKAGAHQPCPEERFVMLSIQKMPIPIGYNRIIYIYICTYIYIYISRYLLQTSNDIFKKKKTCQSIPKYPPEPRAAKAPGAGPVLGLTAAPAPPCSPCPLECGTQTPTRWLLPVGKSALPQWVLVDGNGW